MKVGDLVLRRESLVRESLGRGIILDFHIDKDGCFYYEVQWVDHSDDRVFSRAWYQTPELEVISASR